MNRRMVKRKLWNIYKLANVIEKSETYDQSLWDWKGREHIIGENRCSTPACIYGHMAVVFPKLYRQILLDVGKSAGADAVKHGDIHINMTIAEVMSTRILGISKAEGNRLCISEPDGSEQPVPARVAANVLRNLARTGKVQWDKYLCR